MVSTPLETQQKSPDDSVERSELPSDLALDSTLLGYVAEGTFGPYQAQYGQAKMALWAAPVQGRGRHWFSTPLLGFSTVPAEPLELVEAPAEVELVSLKGMAQGFLALFTSPSQNGTHLTALALSPTGTLPAGTAPLILSRTEIMWIEAMKVGPYPSALWATRAEDSADLHFASLSVTGAPRKSPVELVRNVHAWQAVPWSQGVAVATIRGKAKSSKRRLEMSFFDPDGSLLSQQVLMQEPSIGTELDAASLGGQLVVAWSQLPKGQLEPTIYGVAIGQDGQSLSAPRALLKPFGTQRLVQLVPSRSKREDGHLIWENVGQGSPGERDLLISRISQSASLDPKRATLRLSRQEGRAAEFSASSQGLAALTRVRACPAKQSHCTEEAPIPTYVEFDREMQVVASEPLRLASEQGTNVSQAWGLQCSVDQCTALGALATSPVPVYALELRARSNHFRAAGERLERGVGPRVESMRAMAHSNPLASVSSTRVGKESLVATVTQFDPSTPYKMRRTPAPDGRKGPIRAILRVGRHGPGNAHSYKQRVLSYRARSVSGVKIVTAPRQRGLVLWSALDNKQPEVFATLVNRDGKRLQQRMLTRAPGEVRALAGASVNRGFVVAWIDERSGSPQAYSAALTPNLGRRAAQQEISVGQTSVGALSLLRVENSLHLALLGDSTEGPQTLSVLKLDPGTGAPVGNPRTVATSAERALSFPTLVDASSSPLLLWLDAASGTLKSTRLQAPEHPPLVATRAEWAAPLKALTAECVDGQCRAVVDVQVGKSSRLAAAVWQDNEPSHTAQWVWRNSASGAGSSVSLTNGNVFYSDPSASQAALRHLSVQWTPKSGE